MTTKPLDRFEASLRLPSSGLKTLFSPTLRLHSSIIIHHHSPLFITDSIPSQLSLLSTHSFLILGITRYLLISSRVSVRFSVHQTVDQYQTRVALPCNHCRSRKLNRLITEATTEKLLNIVDRVCGVWKEIVGTGITYRS